MASEFIESTLNYRFADLSLLSLALKSPHRSDIDKVSDDGNRGLAKIGLYAVDVVAAQAAAANDNGTRVSNWYRPRRSRELASKKLGLARFVIPSIRQHGMDPSPKILANALTAIIGAVWLDMEQKNETVSSTGIQILEILSRINAVVTDTAQGSGLAMEEEFSRVIDNDRGDTFGTAYSALQNLTPNETYDQGIDSMDDFMARWFMEVQHMASPSMGVGEIQGTVVGFDLGSAFEGQTSQLQHSNIDDAHESETFNLATSPHVIEAEPSEQSLQCEDGAYRTSSVATTTYNEVAPRKRRHLPDREQAPVGCSVYHRLFQEESAKLVRSTNSSNHSSLALLRHPCVGELSSSLIQINRMNWLYLVIGSGQSLIDYKELLRTARDKASKLPTIFNTNLSPMERFKEICQLDDQEALCVLTRRYHAVKLCETELTILQQEYEMTIETPDTLARGQRATRGNPVMRHEAALTDRMLHIVRPGLEKGTTEYNRFRTRLLRLRRLVKRLRMLTQEYGYGILALLPCGPSDYEPALTDNALLEFTEEQFGMFSRLLSQEQGSILKPLSAAIEPSLTTLINGLTPTRFFPLEDVGVEMIRNLPKGSREMIMCLMGHTVGGQNDIGFTRML